MMLKTKLICTAVNECMTDSYWWTYLTTLNMCTDTSNRKSPSYCSTPTHYEMLTATSLVAPLYYGKGSLCMEVAYLGYEMLCNNCSFQYSILMLFICSKFLILDSIPGKIIVLDVLYRGKYLRGPLFAFDQQSVKFKATKKAYYFVRMYILA